MSDFQQAPDWWQASDGKWYAPQPTPAPEPPRAPTYSPPPAPPSFTQPPAAPYGTGPAQFAAPLPAGYPSGYNPGGHSPYGQQQGLPSVQGMSVASLVLGIIGILTSFCFIGGPLGLIGLPLGLVSMSKIKKGDADPSSRGLALAGVICSGLAIALVIFWVIWIASRPTSGFYYNYNR